MATTRTIRVIRIWEAEVDAEYGDTDEALCAKVDDTWLDANDPQGETRVILEAFDSSYDTRQQFVCPDCSEDTICDVHAEDPHATVEADPTPEVQPAPDSAPIDPEEV